MVFFELLEGQTPNASIRDFYDDEYFDKFFTSIRPVFEERLSESVTATASAITAAWEQAGRPVLTLERVRPLQKVRKP